MRGRFAEQLIARPCVDPNGDLIGHRPRRHEERSLLAQKLGRALLEELDGRVFSVDIVTDRGFGHRASHRGRRLGNGVGPQVDQSSGHCGEPRSLFGDHYAAAGADAHLIVARHGDSVTGSANRELHTPTRTHEGESSRRACGAIDSSNHPEGDRASDG